MKAQVSRSYPNSTTLVMPMPACIGAICPGSGFGYGTKKGFMKGHHFRYLEARHFSHVVPFLAFQILNNITILKPLLQFPPSIPNSKG